VFNFIKNAWAIITTLVAFTATVIGIIVNWHTLFPPEPPKSEAIKSETDAPPAKDLSAVGRRNEKLDSATLTEPAKSERSFFIRPSENGREERGIAQGIADALESKGYPVTNSAKNARCVVDVNRISIEKEIREVNGNNVWFVTARSEVRVTCATNNNPLISKIPAEGKVYGNDVYDLPDKARDAMIGDAVKQLTSSSGG
jgi:hypothetical protein